MDEHSLPSVPPQPSVEPSVPPAASPIVSAEPAITAMPPQPAEGIKPPASPTVNVPEIHPPRRWSWLLGGLAGALLISVLALGIGWFVRTKYAAIRPPAVKANELMIPTERAADAFSLTAEHSDASGIEPETTFLLQARVPVTLEQVKNKLHILPPTEINVEQQAAQTFVVRPAAALAKGTVYRFALATVVSQSDGTLAGREFSWALQTKNDLRVLASVPGHGSSGVPITTGIEFKLTYAGWENVTSSFEIQPPVDGTFQTRGRTLVFVPNKPLQYAQRYEIILKKGLKLANSDLVLAEDKHVGFETEVEPNSAISRTPLDLDLNEFNEVITGRDLQLITYSYSSNVTTTVEATGFALSEADARQLLKARLAIPDWAVLEKRRGEVYAKLAKNQTFKARLTLERQEQFGALIAALPKFDKPGFFIVNLHPEGGRDNWIFVQVSNSAAYVVADKQTLLVWAVNAATQKPLGHAAVLSEDGTAQTDEQGLARLPAPLSFASTTQATNASATTRLLEIGSGPEKLFVPIWGVNRGAGSWAWYDMGPSHSALETTWGYLYLDRPLYHPTDELSFFGLAQDRASRHAISDHVRVTLMRDGLLYDQADGDLKTYQETSVQADAAGRFTGSVKWDQLMPGYYQLAVWRDGSIVVSRFFEVREFIKPTYSLTLTPDSSQIFAGDTARGSVVARFYDGTPVPRAQLHFSVAFDNEPEQVQTLTTDENGYASFGVQTKPSVCPSGPKTYCASQRTLALRVTPTVGEEGEITGLAYVSVFRSSLALDVQARVVSSTATLAIQSNRQTLNLGTDAKIEAWGGRRITGTVLPWQWEKIPDGQTYDFIEKRVVPRYRYERRDEPAQPFEVVTDVRGQAAYAFQVLPDKQYEIVIESDDGQGRISQARTYAAFGWNGFSTPGMTPDTSLHLSFVPLNDTNQFVQDETVTARVERGSEPLDVSRLPGVLYVVTSRGIKRAETVASNAYTFPFNQDLQPNANVRAVFFDGQRFQLVENSLFLKKDQLALDLTATTDQASYAPGSTVKLHITAKRKDTAARAAFAKVAYSAIDKALDGIIPLEDEEPLNTLLAMVPDGLVLETFTHQQRGDGYFGGGGAEKGGGGAGDVAALQVRRIFKDTAAFGTVDLDANGEADVSFKVPDNLTTWRVQTVGLSDDGRAGAAVALARVTKPVFVDVVVPPRLLASDKPVIKLRTFGSGLASSTPVTFVLQAPTLGLQNQSVSGTAGVATYIALESLPVGRHALTVTVKTPQGEDALERNLEIVVTRFQKDEYTRVEAKVGIGLPTTEDAEMQVQVVDRGRASLLPLVSDLAWLSSARAEARIASRLMRQALQTSFGQTLDEREEDDLTVFQDYTGGIKPLAYASPDTKLTAEVAQVAASAFDQASLADYLWSKTDASGTREERLAALAGLAALQQPVLPALQAATRFTDLTWRERLTLARGLVAIGDRENARTILESLLAQAQDRDDTTFIQASDQRPEIFEATAEAAGLAAELAHPRATQLAKFVQANYTNDAFPILSKLWYVQQVLPTLRTDPAAITYTLNDSQRRVALDGQPSAAFTLTAAEARSFRVTKVEGAADLVVVRRIAGRPSVVPDLTVTRSYKAPRPLDQLLEGDVVPIDLQVTWSAAAQNGCYALRDHLPGGWQAVVNPNSIIPSPTIDTAGEPRYTSYPDTVQNGEVSFVVCRFDPQPVTVRYISRIVSRGTYTAEPAVVQHLERPTVAALSTEQIVVVK